MEQQEKAPWPGSLSGAEELSLIEQINELQKKYQTMKKESREEKLPEEKKQAGKEEKELFAQLYDGLLRYVHHVVEVHLYGLKEKESIYGVVQDAAVDKTMDILLGQGGKPGKIETFESKNNAKFTTFCYDIARKKVLDAQTREKTHWLYLCCENREDLKAMRNCSMAELAGRSVALEEADEYTLRMESERIRRNPEQIYLEQLYREERITMIKYVMELVSRGVFKNFQPVYRNVGGAFGAYLSPVAATAWQQPEWLEGGRHCPVSLVQELVVQVAKQQMEKALVRQKEEKVLAQQQAEKASAQQKGRKSTERVLEEAAAGLEASNKKQQEQKIEACVREKLALQLEKTLASELEKAEEAGKEVSLEMQLQPGKVYYDILADKYKGEVQKGAVTATAWAWRVLQTLTPGEAAWLFEHEMQVCVPALDFRWKNPLKAKLGEETEAFQTVTNQDTYANWPQQLQKAVLELCGGELQASYAELLEDIREARKKLLTKLEYEKGALGIE